MNRRKLLAIMALGALAGCDRARSSRLNPLNWFGRAEAVPATSVAAVPVSDPRPLVDTVTALRVEPTPGGAIVHAAAVPAGGGWYAAALVPEPNQAATTRTYQFRAQPPPEARFAATPAAREIVVATYLTGAELAGIREIRVRGARNALSVRR